MSIYRCKYCKHISECNHPNATSTQCCQCGKPVMVFDTVTFVEHLVKRYNEVAQELHKLKQHPDMMVVAEVKPVLADTPPVVSKPVILQQSYLANNYKKKVPVFLR